MAAKKSPESDDALSTPENPTEREVLTAESEDTAGEETTKLDLEISVEKRGACERHVTITISHEDIDRYYDNEFSDLTKTAEVPGFRPGHTPRKLIETRFRKEVADQVKSALLMDAIGQANEQEDLSPISEPNIEFDAVKLPESGPMTFEFDIEVRPEFDVPQWKGLSIRKPVREFTEQDVDRRLESLLSRFGRLVPYDGPAEQGDYISVNMTFKDKDQVLSHAEEEVIRIRPTLSFRDGKIEKFNKLMKGVTAGETREGKATLTQDAPNVALRGKKVTAEFEVLEVKRLELPELTPEFLEAMGGFESEAELRDAVKENLESQLTYEQHQEARQQITAALTVAADWELPAALLERQSRRELQRAVLELQRSGFGEDEIRSHQNMLRQNSRESTARALKEHFILERIAEDQNIEVDEADLEQEILEIAQQTGESSRRVRSRIEKGGMTDALSNQVVERKVIDMILSEAVFTEVPYEPEEIQDEAVDQSAGGHDESDIPEAKPEDEEEASNENKDGEKE
ncbi:MAG: trigger factor [Pirellulales bacterium]|nr:trigger factor [Pirellulales bacterium]